VAEGFQPGGRAAAPPPLDLVQDFVNTEIPDFAQDDIATPALLGVWLHGRDLLEPGDSVSAAGFVAARELRDALRELALLNTAGAAPGKGLRERVRAVLSEATLRVELDALGRLVPVPARAGEWRGLAAIAAVAVLAQADGSWSRLKACRKEGCGWLFYDRSRNLSSSWCSMSICGNRTKTAAYRRRKAAT
jgi:predicted RNA-binding Zn ribbon-like protein